MSLVEVRSTLWSGFSLALVLLVAILATFVIIVPQVLGAVPLAILSGSMRPTVPPGSLVVVQPASADSIRIGHVITYQKRSDDPTLITHRVQAIGISGTGERSFIVKGDNNEFDDPPVKEGQVMGRVVYAVPYFGWVTTGIHTERSSELIRWAAYAFIAYGLWTVIVGIRAPADTDESVHRRHAGPTRRGPDVWVFIPPPVRPAPAQPRAGAHARRAHAAGRRSVEHVVARHRR